MFRLVERARARRQGQDGFSLIEVIVAVGLLVLVMVALLPELVVGIRATAGAKSLTQAKGVLQGRLEVMRSMPYHVGQAAGPYIDMLDTYYRDVAPSAVNPPAGCQPGGVWVSPVAEWSGFVAASKARCPYEPASGAFYRKVIPDITAVGLGTFTLVVDTAFLNSAVPPAAVTPEEWYTSQAAGLDIPPSRQVGVWATIVYRASSALKPVTTYTQISARNPVESSLEVSATVNTVRVSSQSPVSLITLDAGVVAQSGARFTESTVSMNANAVSAGSGTGAMAEGAKAALRAPASASQVFTQSGWQGLNGSCQFMCFGPSSVSGASVSAVDGLPLSADPMAPVRAALSSEFFAPGYKSAKYGGFSFNNGPDASGPVAVRGLSALHPMVTMDGDKPGVSYMQANCTSLATLEAENYVSATGFLDADPVTDGTPAVTSCVTARTAPVMLFPTDWAPGGVVRVTLHQSSLQCRVVRTDGVRSAVPTWKYSATVQYKDKDGDDDAYVTIPNPQFQDAPTITDLNTINPLTETLLEKYVAPGFQLKHFIQSWRTSTKTDVDVHYPPDVFVPTGSAVQAKIPGVVSIDSQPTRLGDQNGNENSVVSVTVGTFQCAAKDVR